MNQVTVDGTITNKIWSYSGDTLFRLRHDDGQAYFTVRFRNMPLDVAPGNRVVITGELISRDQRVSLEDFVSRAGSGGDGDPDEETQELMDQLAGQLRPVNRSYTEILAREIRPLK
jgi:hypothetical protein